MPRTAAPSWLLGGLTLALGGLALLATMPLTISYYRVLGYLVICGLGLGPTLPLYTLAVQNAVAPALVGQATAASQFFRQMGGVLAASVLGAVLTVTLSRELPAPPSGTEASPSEARQQSASRVMPRRPTPARQAAFAHALQRIYWLDIGLVLAGLVVTLTLPELPLQQRTATPAPTGD